MLTAKNLERMIALEDRLKEEYQTQIDAKTAELEICSKQKEEQTATIAKQLEQIKTLSAESSSSKKLEQQNRELHQRCENLKEEMATLKTRLKSLQKDLAEEREEIKTLKQFDPAKMKKNLDATKKKLAEKTTATDLLQKSLNKSRSENIELESTVKELEAKVEELDKTETEEEVLEEAAA
ncbi:MAG: chromosome segregation ATPase [Halioglobus sp.]|jgi:chromosome segregation ATPase